MDPELLKLHDSNRKNLTRREEENLNGHFSGDMEVANKHADRSV